MDTEKINDPKPTDEDPIAEMGVEAYSVLQSIAGAQEAKLEAVKDIVRHQKTTAVDADAVITALESILEGASPDDAESLRYALSLWQDVEVKEEVDPDEELVKDWRSANYPYKNRMLRKNYEQQKYH